LVGCAVAHTGRVTWEHSQLQAQLRAASAAAALVPPHSTVDVYCQDEWKGPPGRPPWQEANPLKHVRAYYGFARDVALFENYEVRYPYLPIRRGEGAWEDPDYILLWPLEDGEVLLAEFEDRPVLHHRDGAALLGRAPQATPLWEGTRVLDPLSADDGVHHR